MWYICKSENLDICVILEPMVVLDKFKYCQKLGMLDAASTVTTKFG